MHRSNQEAPADFSGTGLPRRLIATLPVPPSLRGFGVRSDPSPKPLQQIGRLCRWFQREGLNMITRLSIVVVMVALGCRAAPGQDAIDDPGFSPESRFDDPNAPGAFDTPRGDLGTDEDPSTQATPGTGARRRFPANPPPVTYPPDPLAGSPKVDPAETARNADLMLARMLPPRSDSLADWFAPLECLHGPCEPYALPPCVPPPPCHPSEPPQPYDLVGVRGVPTGGPIYGGPCCPRTGSHDHCRHPHAHRACDRLFDWFYMYR
jgi:hypothetical protein